jgi:alkylation response protein AidB-like acyl-CoA dehydrogenase
MPERDGGLGAGLAEATIIHEEIGRAAVPGPVTVTSLLAPHVPGASDGTAVVTAAFTTSRPVVVEHLAGSDLVAVMSRTEVRLVPTDAVAAELLDVPLDPLTPVYLATGDLSAAEQSVLGGAVANNIFEEGTLLTAAAAVGLAAAAVDLATSYAKERMQFGRPIGSFQAIKHLIADAHADTEVARAAVHSAAVEIDETAPAAAIARAVAGARLLASRAAARATRACIQVHGGMGYTWEVDAHLLLKRALVLDTHFDTPRISRDRLAAGL